MASTRSYRQGEVSNADGRKDPRRNELRRRATSDPKPPARVVKSSVENALDRAYEKKLAQMASITQKDVDRMKARSSEAEEELRSHLDDLGQMSTDITRRLDYTYYSLLERIGSLVSTIHSFQSLATQSRALVDGFEKEAEHLDTDIKRRVAKFEDGFSEREVRVADLEQRGTKARTKAEQLGKRLESARIIVEDWQKRENDAVRARARMWKGTWFTVIGVLGIIMMLVVWKEWSSGVDAVRAGLGTPERGSLNKSLMIDEGLLRKKQIPDDVKSILHGIETRRSSRGSTWTLPALVPVETPEDDDKRLRALDEL
jgi:predicted  nucleic acid-binding Zn-ribbon protein